MYDMIKYLNVEVVFEEIPDEITLAINITNCQCYCAGCHSPELRCDIGTELTEAELDRLIAENDGITCICLMGEGNDRDAIYKLVQHLMSEHPNLKRAIYYGRDHLDRNYLNLFHYVKYGSYKEECGPLNVETTNQRLIKTDFKTQQQEDITYKFWKRK